MKTFYTSDTHFFHKNIIKYCARPYATVEDMHVDLIKKWNETVGPGDVVYHLGDFGFGRFDGLRQIAQRLNGQKIIVKGNHDRSVGRLKEMGFHAACEWIERDENGVRWLLIHNPGDVIVSRPGVSLRDVNVLCGHVHTRWARKWNVINVGVDVQGFTPRTIEEILATPETPNMPPLESMPCPKCNAQMEWADVNFKTEWCRSCGHRE